MIALCRVVKRYNGGYFTHMRDESNKVLEAVEEAIAIAEACGVHVEIVHFKCSGPDNWGKAARALDMIAAAKAARARRRLRRLSLRRRQQPAQEPDAAMGAGGGVAAMLERLAQRGRRAHASALTSPATASTTGAVCRRGIACRFRSRRTCRNMPAARSARSRPSAARTRSTPSPTILIADKGATRVLVTSISGRRHPRPSCARRLRSSVPTAIASRPTAP